VGAEKVQQHLRRIEGQVKGLQRMVAEERDCEEVLTQIMAVKAALDRVTQDLVAATMADCFDRLPPEEVKRKLAKTLAILARM
jgi:DNA-binding FrmR family transcriptional regulator